MRFLTVVNANSHIKSNRKCVDELGIPEKAQVQKAELRGATIQGMLLT